MIDCLLGIWSVIQQNAEFVADLLGGWGDAHGIQTLSAIWAIEQYCLCILVGDIAGEGYSP